MRPRNVRTLKKMKSRLLLHTLLWLLPASIAFAADPVSPMAPAVSQPAKAYPLSAFAAIGSSFADGNHLPELGWNEAQIAAFIDGIRAAFQGKSYPFDDAAGQVSAEMGQRIQEILARGQPQASEVYAPPGGLESVMKGLRETLGLQKADSGLAYRVEIGRGGPRPRLDDTLVFSCVATAVDGKTALPQVSAKRTRAKMKDLFPGFIEGLQMMTLDSTAVFVLPPNLSFGESEWPQGVMRGSPIIFQVTLHQIISQEPAR
jgi:FKBP-type peptidyl-prolyl cis-trans isomerase